MTDDRLGAARNERLRERLGFGELPPIPAIPKRDKDPLMEAIRRIVVEELRKRGIE
jgi:hypothetical protein